MRRLILIAACCSLSYGADPKALVLQVAAYDYGKDPSAVRELEALVLHSGASLEELLLTGLSSSRTLAAKDIFCRLLAVAGADRAVTALAPMLLQPDTAEMARYALEQIPGDLSLRALHDALSR